MTAKEAIYILRNAAWLGSDADRQKVEEAVEVVAKAIEAQDMTLYMNLPEVSAEEVVEILKRNNRIELIPNDKDTNVPSNDSISRQRAIDMVRDVCDAIMSCCDSYYDPETGDEIYKDILEVDAILKCNKEIRIALRNMPSADVQPVVHGKWIVFKAPDALHCGLVKCPFCSEELTAEPDEYHYCPNCGAKMDKRKGEDDVPNQ